jgi:hypothetical protein
MKFLRSPEIEGTGMGFAWVGSQYLPCTNVNQQIAKIF